MTTTTPALTVPELGEVPVTVTQRGDGRPVLVLHGGAGPLSVGAWADDLAAATGWRVLTPTHPGFGGTPRPEPLHTVTGLAAVYAALLESLDLTDVLVVGNSVGGWIAAEMALLAPTRVSASVVVDAVGLELAGHPVADVFSLTPTELAERSWYAPEGRALDVTALPAAQQQVVAANMATLAVYGGPTMTDASLGARLATVTVPVLVVWGEADRVVDVEVGRAYAAAIPHAEFVLVERAGHLPQLEQPAALTAAVRAFAATVAR